MKPLISPRELARAIGVSESSVKRWVDGGVIRASRTAGGHRRIASADAIRFIRESKSPLLHPEVLGLDEVQGSGRGVAGFGQEGEALFQLLRDGSAREAKGFLMSLYLEGRGMAQIFDGPLRQAMERIGELWLSEPSGIFWEHRATQIAIEAVIRLRALVAPREGAPVAVGGAPEGDPYIIPSLCVAAVLEAEGLEVVNLGPDTPLATLRLAVDELDASMAWLSVSGNGKALQALDSVFSELADDVTSRGIPLVLGGHQLEKLSTPSSDLIYRGSSMVELEALVRGMRLSGRIAAPVD